jgi:hypothetical protein
MRYQNKQRYPPIANAKPLPTLLQRGAAATATEIAKEAANEEDEPPPGHRHGACRSIPPPMPGERRQKAHHRHGTTVAEFFSPEFGASADGLEQYPPVSAMTPTLDREAPGRRDHRNSRSIGTSVGTGRMTWIGHRWSIYLANLFHQQARTEVPGRHALGGDRQYAGNPTRAG